MSTDSSINFWGTMQKSIDNFFHNINISARDVIAYVTYFAIAFLVGVAIKRYGKWMVAMILGAIMVMATLQYFELVFVNQCKIRCLLGLQNIHSFHSLINFLKLTAEKFWVEGLLSLSAICLGFKLG